MKTSVDFIWSFQIINVMFDCLALLSINLLLYMIRRVLVEKIIAKSLIQGMLVINTMLQLNSQPHTILYDNYVNAQSLVELCN